MRLKNFRIEKIVITSGVPQCDRQRIPIVGRILESIFGRRPQQMLARSNIRDFGTSIGKPLGFRITLRRGLQDHMRILLMATNNRINSTSIGQENTVSFGITNHLLLPNQEANIEEGIIGFNVNVVFRRPGARVAIRNRNPRRLPRRMNITREEMVEFLNNLGTTIL